MDDPAAAAAAADLGAAQLHGEDAVALEADVADRDLLAGRLLAGRGLDDRRAGLAAEEQRGRVALGIAADEQHALALLRHAVAEVGEGEALADATLAIDRDDLRFLLLLRDRRAGRLGGGGLGQNRTGQNWAGRDWLGRRGDAHGKSLQSRIILVQAGSLKACS